MKLKRVLYIPDCHFPRVDKKSYELMLEVAKDFNPDEIVILGDFFDVFCLSRYDKDPLQNFNLLTEELATGKAALAYLDKTFKKSKITYLSGNHEARVPKYISVYAGKLGGILETNDILGVPKRFQFHPYCKNQGYRIGKLLARHGTKCGKFAMSKSVEHLKCSVIEGHHHFVQEFHATDAFGIDLIALSSGWLGDEKHADYVQDKQPWTQAFTLAYFFPNGDFHHQIIEIHNGKLVFDGEIYK